jgi:hypothetical protein
MRITQEMWTRGSAGRVVAIRGECKAPQLVLGLGSPEMIRQDQILAQLRERWPQATLVVGSTAGEICGTRVLDDSFVATAIEFESVKVQSAMVELDQIGDSKRAGELLVGQLEQTGLRHVFVLSDGLKVNGSELVLGLTGSMPPGVSLSGGLCGDGARFERTHVCIDRFDPGPRIVAVGLYGSALRVGLGSLGGWDPFGPERRVTRSVANVLYELDGRPALDLYEEYLGERAAGLPASGLLFPLAVRDTRQGQALVRTILAVDRAARSLTFAGDIPPGHFAQLMRSNLDRLLDGAAGAAQSSCTALASGSAELAILISCVGRKLVMTQRVEEEVESVQQVLGTGPILTGFYSYGEISPFTPTARCELHNQTMTITTLAEVR